MRRSLLWLIMGVLLGIALTLLTIKIYVDRWFAPGTFELSAENIERLGNLDIDALYNVFSHGSTEEFDVIDCALTEDGELDGIMVRANVPDRRAFGGTILFTIRFTPNYGLYPPGDYSTRYNRYGLEAALEEKWSIEMGLSSVRYSADDYQVSVIMYTVSDYDRGVSIILDWLEEKSREPQMPE